jgi:hypothetical protein
MITMTAQVYVDDHGSLHERNIEVTLHDTNFSISQGEVMEDEETVWVENEDQARDLMTAIKAMCAAHGWEV